MTDFWVGIVCGFLGGFWLFSTLAVLLTMGMERVPTVDGAHVQDEDDDEEMDGDWIISEALLRTGSHE